MRIAIGFGYEQHAPGLYLYEVDTGRIVANDIEGLEPEYDVVEKIQDITKMNPIEIPETLAQMQNRLEQIFYPQRCHNYCGYEFKSGDRYIYVAQRNSFLY